MPRRCTICFHPERAEIEKALLAGESFRNIAERWDVSLAPLVRHKEGHLAEHLIKAQEVHEVEQALDVLQQLKAINAACLEVLNRARGKGDSSTLLRAVDRIHRQIELQARLLGEIQDGPTVNVVLTPEWQRIRQVVVLALAPYPEARTAVVQALSHAGS